MLLIPWIIWQIWAGDSSISSLPLNHWGILLSIGIIHAALVFSLFWNKVLTSQACRLYYVS